ncbi:HupE/UreJ family protein [Rhodobacterales bacterium HKCCE3408]|nr:HupE/UreJ family protein [Rhodobacterales bacterium HKCCE3408]
MAGQLIRAMLLSMALAITVAAQAVAHEIRPAISDVEVGAETVTIRVRMALEGLSAGIDLETYADTNNAPEADIYEVFRQMEPEAYAEAFRADWPAVSQGFIIEVNGERLEPEIVDIEVPAVGNTELPRDSILTIQADLPPGADPVVFGWRASYGTLVVRQVGGGADAYEGFLTGGDLSEPLPRDSVATEGWGKVFVRYIGAGFEHIVPLGLDHILFVLGLFFFALQVRPLLSQVTAFTLAHTITLALAATGVVSIPPSVVEPLIAATIVYVGVENVLGGQHTRARTAVVFGFGLLHGLGFASVLGIYGIASGRFVPALVGFNIGVELGQLTVIAAAFLAVGLWFGRKPWYRKVIAIPASVVISAIGAYWVVERTLL